MRPNAARALRARNRFENCGFQRVKIRDRPGGFLASVRPAHAGVGLGYLCGTKIKLAMYHRYIYFAP